METLTPDTMAWARRVGLSPDRVAFLAACPKFTVCGEHARHRKLESTNPNRYIMKSGAKYYFRVHSRTGKDTVIPLGFNLNEARSQRDALLTELKTKKVAFTV